jgi:hypothetical protein
VGAAGVAVAGKVDEPATGSLRGDLERVQEAGGARVFDVRARFVRPARALRSEDFPTFERPTSASSDWLTGRSPAAAAERRNRIARATAGH